jgi:hypothetical protein
MGIKFYPLDWIGHKESGSRAAIIDYAGTRHYPNGTAYHVFRFACDCGAVFESDWNSVRNGNVRSCGCLRAEAGKRTGRIAGKKYGGRNFNGIIGKHGEISSAFWRNVKGGAKVRGIVVEITRERAMQLFDAQEARCALTGVSLTLCRPSKGETTASLDRIDSDSFYVEGNLQWVHKVVQSMKMALPQDEFILWCDKVAKHAISCALVTQKPRA